MAKLTRYKTDYPGVYYIMGQAVSNGKPEKIYYIRYRKNGKSVEEKAGRQFQDDMTPARASNLRGLKIAGKEVSNEGRPQTEKRLKEAATNKWKIDKLWEKYKSNNPGLKGIKTYKSQYNLWLKSAIANKACDTFMLQCWLLRVRLECM